MRKIWDMFFMLVFAGIPVGVAVFLSTNMDSGGIPAATIRSTAQGSLYGSLVQFSGMLLAVMLAILAVITSMDERPLIKKLRERKDQAYTRLVYALVSPVFVAAALVVFAIVCLALTPLTDTTSLPSRPADVVVSITLGIGATLLGQVGYAAILIVRMLVFEGRQPHLTDRDQAPKGIAPVDQNESVVTAAKPAHEHSHERMHPVSA